MLDPQYAQYTFPNPQAAPHWEVRPQLLHVADTIRQKSIERTLWQYEESRLEPFVQHPNNHLVQRAVRARNVPGFPFSRN